MNYFNRKYICIVFALLCVATTLGAEQNSLKDQNPFKDLVDNNLEGFFLSGGVGFGIGQAEINELDVFLRHSSAQIQWKAGYVHSSRLGVYLTSTLGRVTPKFGVMWYLGRMSYSPRHYLQVLIKFSEGAFYSGGLLQSLEGGFGYEVRPHFVFDAVAGYKRRWDFPLTYRHGNDRDEFVVVPTELTLAVSVNYRFY